MIESLVEDYGEELVLLALKKSLEAGKRNLNYTKGTLKNWKRDGIKAVNDIEEKEQKSSSTKVTLTKDGTFKIN